MMSTTPPLTEPASALPGTPRHTVAGVYGSRRSLAYRCRTRRFAHVRPLIERIIADKGRCRVLDIGGTEYYWNIFGSFVGDHPLEIDLLNLDVHPTSHPRMRSLRGDATDLGGFDDMSYDLVHSNSVIEHVGTWRQMAAMARNVRRLAPAYYLQTPNFWFPVEPHFRAVAFHWLPEPVRARLLMRFNLGFGGRRPTLDAAMQAVQSAALLDRRQLAELFPDARIERERFWGLTKSLMAIRDPI